MTTRERSGVGDRGTPGNRGAPLHSGSVPLLVGEAFSPWTQKARWALLYCGVDHGYREYVPLLDEPWLRWRLRAARGPVTVPVLFTRGGPLRDSWAIAQHASALAGDGRLGDPSRTRAWNELSEAALAEGRARLLRALRADPQALAESLPAAMPAALKHVLQPLAGLAVRRLQRKYVHLAQYGALRQALLQVRAQLAARRGHTLLGRFSHADIAMLVVLEMVSPAARLACPLGPASRRCWSDPQLAAEFPDLLRWRDRIAADPALAPPWLHVRQPGRSKTSAPSS